MVSLWISIIILTLFALAILFKPCIAEIESFQLIKLKKNLYTCFFLFLFIPILSIVLYFILGKSQAVGEWLNASKNSKEVRATIEKMGSRQNIIEALRAKLIQL